MFRILLIGYNGRMGKAVSELVSKSSAAEIVAGVDINPSISNSGFPIFTQISDFSGKADVIIDFYHHSFTESLLQYSIETQTPVVIATTGHTDEEKKLIRDCADKTAIFMSANMSLGINLMIELSKKAAVLLQRNYDIEIIEKHHNQKLDAPSGTALMIANGIKEAVEDEMELVYDRHSERKVRGSQEIGMHAIRGGTIVGEHEVIFAGRDEIFTITHSALSREVFASGALKAALYMSGRDKGMYDMKRLLDEAIGE